MAPTPKSPLSPLLFEHGNSMSATYFNQLLLPQQEQSPSNSTSSSIITTSMNGNGRKEEISTIFVVGFPEDMQEREFQNMFLFSSGFEAATLKIPSSASTAAAAAVAKTEFMDSVIDLVFEEGKEGDRMELMGQPDYSIVTQQQQQQQNKKQIIGFAKFRTRREALLAKEVLNGKKIDNGHILKAEMAKKNLHTKKGNQNQHHQNQLHQNQNQQQQRQQHHHHHQRIASASAAFDTAKVQNQQNSISDSVLISPTNSADIYVHSNHSNSSIINGNSGNEVLKEEMTGSAINGNNIMSTSSFLKRLQQRNHHHQQQQQQQQQHLRNNQYISNSGASTPLNIEASSSSTYNNISSIFHAPYINHLNHQHPHQHFHNSIIASPSASSTSLLLDKLDSLAAAAVASTVPAATASSPLLSPPPFLGLLSPTNSYQQRPSNSNHLATPPSTTSSTSQLAPTSNNNNLADQNPPCNTLYVGNLPPNTNEQELRHLFSKCSGYKRMSFKQKSNGPMCFVEFEDTIYAAQALQELHGVPLSNSVKGGIRLSFSKNPLGVRQSNPTSAVMPTSSASTFLNGFHQQ